ncbi:MAG: tetratricopeptide repeat protein, partial [Sedimentisphaerales bacterium]|nr:tetratricopeptide repeat protein [Sedimentisphaerales bacterium]
RWLMGAPMINGQIILPKRRGRKRDYREVATKGSWSVIFVILALVAIRPLMVSQILSRAEAYAASGFNANCRRQCNKALLLDGDNSRAWHQLGRIYKAQGNREMAYEAYHRATETDLANGPAHFELGLMYVQDDQHQQAIPYLERVRTLGPDAAKRDNGDGFAFHKTALDMLALCYEKAGHTTKAEFTLEEIRVFYPAYTGAEARLAQLKERNGS